MITYNILKDKEADEEEDLNQDQQVHDQRIAVQHAPFLFQDCIDAQPCDHGEDATGCQPQDETDRKQTRHRGVKVRNTVDGLERYRTNERGFSLGVEYHEHVRIEYYKFSFFSSRQDSYFD